MPRRQTPPPGSDDPLGVGDVPSYVPSDSAPIGVPTDYSTRPYSDISPRQRDIMAGYGMDVPERGPQTSVSSGKGGDDKWPYFDGDEYFPGQLPPESIAALQRQMAQLGLLPPNARFRLGVWDTASQKAYRALLSYANQQGMSYKQALNHFQTTGANFTVDEFGNIVQAGDQTEALPTRTSDPEELALVFRKAVIDTLGQGWDDDKIQSLVKQYQGMEVKQQQASYEAELTGGNVVNVPSPEAFIVSQAEEQDPAAAQSQDMLGFMEDFQQLVTSPAWGA